MPIFENFTIDNHIFPPPNDIEEDESSGDFLKKITMDDGSTRAYKTVSGLKFEYQISWEWLNYHDFEVLKGYVNNGFIQVNHTSTNYKIDNLYLLEPSSWGFDFGAGRKGVKLKLTQQEAPSYE